MRMKQKWRVIGIVIILALIAVPTVGATEFIGADSYELAEGNTTDGNLYVAGETVTINGTVDGDLIAAGTTVILGPTGVVRGDMMAGGQQVYIRGTVDGDVRVAGYLVQAEDDARIGGEMIGAGYSVGALDQSTVGGDFVGFGYQALIDGTIEGDALFAGNALEIRGRVAGDVDAAVERSGSAPPNFPFPGQPAVPRIASPGFNVEQGEIGGNLSLQAPEVDIEIDSDRIGGDVETTMVAPSTDGAPAEPPRSPGVEWLLDWLRTSATLLIFGALALWLAPRALAGSEGFISKKPLPSTATGCGAMLLAPMLLAMIIFASIAVMLLFGALSLGGFNSVVISGAGLAFAGLTAGLNLLAWLARAALALWVGRWILAKASPGMDGNRWIALLIGVLIYAALRHLPYIGFWIHMLWTGLGLGALILLAWPRLRMIGGQPQGTMPTPQPAA